MSGWAARWWWTTAPGASGNIGTEAVVRAAPNGGTLLVSVNTLVMNRSLYPEAAVRPGQGPGAGLADQLGPAAAGCQPEAPATRRRPSWSPPPGPSPAASTTPGPASARRTTCRWSCSRPPPASSSPTFPTAVPRPRSPTCWAARSTCLPAHPRGAAAREGRQAGRAGHRQREAASIAAAGAHAGRGEHRQRERRHVVRHLRAARHPAGVRGSAEPRTQGHPGMRPRCAPHSRRRAWTRRAARPRSSGAWWSRTPDRWARLIKAQRHHGGLSACRSQSSAAASAA